MSITKLPPRTVRLSGCAEVQVGDVAAGVAITPGHLIEYYSDSGTGKFKPHSSAAGFGVPIFALDRPELNHGVDVAYNVGELVNAWFPERGDTVWALIASGVNAALGNFLESAGDGTLRVYTNGTRIAQALEAVNATSLSRIRAQVV